MQRVGTSRTQWASKVRRRRRPRSHHTPRPCTTARRTPPRSRRKRTACVARGPDAPPRARQVGGRWRCPAGARRGWKRRKPSWRPARGGGQHRHHATLRRVDLGSGFCSTAVRLGTADSQHPTYRPRTRERRRVHILWQVPRDDSHAQAAVGKLVGDGQSKYFGRHQRTLSTERTSSRTPRHPDMKPHSPPEPRTTQSYAQVYGGMVLPVAKETR